MHPILVLVKHERERERDRQTDTTHIQTVPLYQSKKQKTRQLWILRKHANIHTLMREERKKEGQKERGEGGRKKKEKGRTAATRIPAWSPTAVLTSRYRA